MSASPSFIAPVSPLKPRLAIMSNTLHRMADLLSNEGKRITPGMLYGRRAGSTYLLEQVESGSRPRASQQTGRIPLLPGDHAHGWRLGYRAAMRSQELQPLGWWFHLAGPVDNLDETLEEVDRQRLLHQPEYHLADGVWQEHPDPLLLFSWAVTERFDLRAATLQRADTALEAVEIDF